MTDDALAAFKEKENAAHPDGRQTLRALSCGELKLTVELLKVIDIVEIARLLTPEKAQYLNTVVENRIRSSEQYLRAVAGTFPGVDVRCTVEKGTAAEVIIERAAADRGTLINMSTHGLSGIKRWLLGSVAEKVLRGATNPLLLIRANAHHRWRDHRLLFANFWDRRLARYSPEAS